MPSLYVHIPFCQSICTYCDFPKLFFREEYEAPYLASLKKELLSLSPTHYDTVYIGGGTPTSLSDAAFASLLALLSPFCDRNTEWSIETNPERLTEEKLDLCLKYGVNRISIGFESSVNRLLALMGRKHDFASTQSAVKRAKQKGITNLNVDLIYALPAETLSELSQDIDAVLSLDVPHVSAYSLIVEKGTKLYLDGYKEATEEDCATQYNTILKRLRENGYDRYEVSNFAREGRKCLHNLVYWKDEEYDAIGLGASGYRGNIRYKNTSSLNHYLAGKYHLEEEIVSQKDDLEYFFLTNLRLEEGFSLETFSSRFGFSFLERYEKEVHRLEKDGLLTLEEGRIKPTDQGILLLDRILITLFP